MAIFSREYQGAGYPFSFWPRACLQRVCWDNDSAWRRLWRPMSRLISNRRTTFGSTKTRCTGNCTPAGGQPAGAGAMSALVAGAPVAVPAAGDPALALAGGL